jgi:DNA-binding beta-propeller fold protein YncE
MNVRAGVLAVVVLLAGCSGGHSSLPPAVPDAAQPRPSSAPNVKPRLVITIPKKTSSASKRPTYISPATQSATIVVDQGVTAVLNETANLTPTSSGCTSTLASTVCTLTLALAPGSYTLTLTTYDGSNGSGNVLSAAQSVPFTIVAGQANTIAVTLGGVPVSIAFLSGSGALTGSAQAGYQLDYGATGVNLSVFGVDADGNLILGAGAPTVSVTSSSTQVRVTGPSTASPNLIQLASNAQTSPAVLTATVTPTAASGASALSDTVTINVPTAPTLYVVDIVLGEVLTYDQEGDQQSLTFGCSNCEEAESMAYDPADQLLYITTSNPSVNAYSASSGAQQTLTGGWPGFGIPEGIAYDSGNGWFYVVDDLNSTVRVFDAQGNAQTLPSGAFSGLNFPEAIAYDPDNGWLYVSQDSAILAFNQEGVSETTSGGFPNLTAAPTDIAYDPVNHWLYVTNEGFQRNISQFVSTVTAYDAQGNQQTLSGGFPNLDNPVSIAYDRANGLFYVVNEPPVTSGSPFINAYDVNGNQQTLTGTFPNFDAPMSIRTVP